MSLHAMRLANQVVEATFREYSGHFRKGKSLKQFYRTILSGAHRAFVVLRDDPEDYVGLQFDGSRSRWRFELWVNLKNRDDGNYWCQAMRTKFRAIEFAVRSPQNPVQLSKDMGLDGEAQNNHELPSSDDT